MKIKTHVIGISFLVVIFTAVLFALLLIMSMRQMYLASVVGEIQRQADAYADFYQKFWQTGAGQLDDSAKSLLASSPFDVRAEVMILDLKGNILADSLSTKYPTAAYPDVLEAQQRGSGEWTGRLAESKEPVAAVTVVLRNISGNSDGYVRIISSLRPMQRRLVQNAAWVGILAGIVILIAGLFAVAANRSVTRRFSMLSGAAQGFARGDMNERINMTGNDEFTALAKTLNQMAQRIEHDENSKNDFLASVSHELKTPLTSIKGWAVTLRHSGEGEKALIEEGFEIIENECDRLQAVLNDLLDYSAIVNGKVQYNLQQLNLAEVVENCLLQMEPVAGAKQIVIACALTDSAMIEADVGRIRQVFINILGNAVKFTQQTGQIKVRIEAASDAEWMVEIADNGPGITATALPYIREKFFKADNRKPGNGLGLAICDEIIVAHGGRMEIENNTLCGVAVRIYLPKIQIIT